MAVPGHEQISFTFISLLFLFSFQNKNNLCCFENNFKTYIYFQFSEKQNNFTFYFHFND